MSEWIADLDTELVFDENKKCYLKNWKGKKIHLLQWDEEDEDGTIIYEVYVDDEAYCDLFGFKQIDGSIKYNCFDGEPYNSAKNAKRAVDNMLKSCFKDKEEEYDESCSSCKGGGCPHCEPHRFVEGFTY